MHTVCFVPETGKIIWYSPVQNDRIIVATDNGLISALCTDGRVLGSLSNQASTISPVLLGANLLTISRDNWLIVWNTERCKVETRFPIPGVAEMLSVYTD